MRKITFTVLMLLAASFVNGQGASSDLETAKLQQSQFRFFGVAMSVANLDRTIDWYSNVFGFALLEKFDIPAIKAKGAFLQGDGFKFELLQSEARFRKDELFAEPPHHMELIGNKALVLSVDDLSKLTSELRLKKVKIVWADRVLNEQGLRNTLVQDPDGNYISIFGKQVNN
jgi:catechol 2,3-dioxygenase-like lactoylglutathione lyase family enzyme